MLRRCYAPLLALALVVGLAACGGTETIEKDSLDPPEPDVQINIQSGCQSDAECDEGGPCMVGVCGEDGECVYQPRAGEACDDGNACTQDDTCSASGACVGSESLGCNDGKFCTEDSCDPKSGCVFTPLSGDMECDGSLCTAGDACVDGVCAGGQVVDCDDPNPTDCTFLVCDSDTGQCTVKMNQPAGYPCADGNPCTDADACDDAGTCLSGSEHECVSQNPCKTAWCNEQAKEGTNPCVTDFVAQGTPCNDDSKCTDNDSCTPVGDGTALQCLGTPVECNDANPCTLDTCAEQAGCAYENKSNGTPCDLPGGGKGSCQEGICQDPGQTDCNDGIACTVDTDLGGGQCQHTPNHALCDDGLACNGVESCDVNQGCLPGVGLDCDDGIACTVDSCNANGCIHTATNSLCDDGNVCTNDLCSPVNGCAYSNNNLPCNDSNPCTTGEQCSNGQCGGGQPVVCDDGVECTADSCDPKSGCVFDDSACEGECTPYAVASCYEGPGGTAGTGRCRMGYKQCLADGSDWSPCYDMQLPLGEDLCGNGVDDDCDGSQNDENCTDQPAGAAWVDGESGNDGTGNGSYLKPWATVGKALSSSYKTIAVRADANGTVYLEDEFKISSSKHKMVMVGIGPTKPVLEGTIDIVHCYDCMFENLELRSPDPNHYAPEDYPKATIDAVHNYRNTWRDIRFTAPNGLPSGKRLADCHHGYDNLFIDCTLEDIVLMPAEDGGASWDLFDWGDHGSGTQFIRLTWLDGASVTGAQPANLSLGFIRVGGYCGNWPKGVSAARNNLVGNLDLQSLAGSSSFQAIDYWCYYVDGPMAGIMVANNTFSNIKAGSAEAAHIDLAEAILVIVTGNIFGPFSSNSSTGTWCDYPVSVTYTDNVFLTQATGGQAAISAGCINADPKFVNTGAGDFSLQADSPCRNTGDPQWTDPDGTPSDMGAFGGPMAE